MIRSLFLAIALLVTIQLDAKKIAGYYIANNGDTVHVTYRIGLSFFSQTPDFERMQRRISYLDNNKKKRTLRPDMAKEIAFVVNGKTIRMLSRKNDLNVGTTFFRSDNLLFLHLIQDGKVQLFKIYVRSGSTGTVGVGGAGVGGNDGGGSTSETYVLQKNGGKLFQTRLFSFKKDLAGFFSDCPALAEKIKDKTYRRSDVEEIVFEYNQKCQ